MLDSSTSRSSATKKDPDSAEQNRPDVARQRAQWTKYRDRIDPARLVFIDATWTETNMAPLRGWAPRGQRLKAKVPPGRWQTMTLLAAPRSHHGSTAHRRADQWRSLPTLHREGLGPDIAAR
jgi:hypothetical protein